CIPIAYDIEYGPSDIITDGVDGFLVPPGDIDALAEAITRFLAMDRAKVVRMREAAIARAQDFSAEKIVQRWGAAIAEAMAAHRMKAGSVEPEMSARLHSVSADGGEAELTVVLGGAELTAPAWAKLAWVGRKKDVYGRSQASVEGFGGLITVTGRVNAHDLALGESGYADVFVDTRASGVPTRTRIVAKSLSEPVSFGDKELYATKHGNLSVRQQNSDGLDIVPNRQ
ncbi:MAG TPA: glycosyltransferase, partial [Candidatus Nesterenkonia stercoripullorum]|nr:glycosyltransferase [Candidatus Nesterenkonia stercoripullorum]